jgi:hypothetical protein
LLATAEAIKEYLPTLKTRTKWNDVVKDLKDGDVVLVLDKDLLRGDLKTYKNIWQQEKELL